MYYSPRFQNEKKSVLGKISDLHDPIAYKKQSKASHSHSEFRAFESGGTSGLPKSEQWTSGFRGVGTSSVSLSQSPSSKPVV